MIVIRKKVRFIPNAITTFGLACGLFVIFKINMVEPGEGTYHVLFTSLLLLLVAALADVLDGAVARVIKAESEFGILFDSLSDAITFGVAPSVLLLKSLSLEPGTFISLCSVFGAMTYSICGVLRLVRFNVKKAESVGNKEEELLQQKNFTGLPIPAAAMAATSMNLFLASSFEEKWLHISSVSSAIFLIGIWTLLGILMISRWKFPSLKALNFKLPPMQLILMMMGLAVVSLYGIFYFFPVALLGITWGYIILGLTLSFIRLLAGKKSKTLEDFEPEEEES
ncbi:CDP-alcohol phosphatidyltransferase family protein [Rhabdochlamydiaceae symbiont of Dictyostelium giganteum]|uniref:CDP-alcohol phosphatidyltransferase family protein n=1 Tax=Rhabdochlamydiaceae symbiont of Dictyostelium giganteum TaxID=3342349 RepID=UPI003850F09B